MLLGRFWMWLTGDVPPVTPPPSQTTYAQIQAMTQLVGDFDPASGSPADGAAADTLVNTVNSAKNGTKKVGGTPVFKTNQCNGKTVVRTVAANGDLYNIGGGGYSLTSARVFIVAKTTGDCFYFGNSAINHQIRNVGGVLTAYYDPAAYHPTSTALTSPNDWNVFEFRVTDALMRMYEAGRARGPSHAGVDSPVNSQWSLSAWVLNQIFGTFDSAQHTGDLARVLIFDESGDNFLTSAQVAAIYDYLDAQFYTGDSTGLSLHPQTVPTTLSHPSQGMRLYSAFNFENAAAVPIGGSLIQGQNFSATDIATYAAFQAALASKVPDPDAAWVLIIDAELTTPCVPAAAADYNGATWSSTDREGYAGDRAYLIALAQYAKAQRPNCIVLVYWHPYIDTVNYISADGQSLLHSWAEAAANADWFDGYTVGSLASQSYAGTHSLAGMLAYCDGLNPELYPKNILASQAMLNRWYRDNVQLCRDISDYFIKPTTAQKIGPILWPQHVPGAVGNPVEGFTSGTYTHSTRTIAISGGGFANYTQSGDPLRDRLRCGSVAKGVSQAHFEIASKTDSNHLVLAGSGLGAGADGATDVVGDSNGVFLTVQILYAHLYALRQSGAELGIIGGDAQAAYYTAAEWAQWWAGTFLSAAERAGLISGNTRLGSVGPGYAGSIGATPGIV